MQALQKILNFYINASVHVALAVTSLVVVTVLEFNLIIDWFLFAFVFFATVTGYNFVKYAEIAGLHHRSLAESLRTIQVFSFMCFTFLCVLFFYIKIQSLFTVFCLGLVTFLYAVPLLRNKNLRTLPGIKVLIVAVVWAGVGVLLPLVESKTTLFIDGWISFLQLFLLVLVWLIPFEIRDLQFDQLSLGTMPQKWGVRTTKLVGIFFLIIALAIEGFKDNISSAHILTLMCVCVLSGVAVVRAQKKQSKYFSALWVESIPIVYALCMFLLCQFLI